MRRRLWHDRTGGHTPSLFFTVAFGSSVLSSIFRSDRIRPPLDPRGMATERYHKRSLSDAQEQNEAGPANGDSAWDLHNVSFGEILRDHVEGGGKIWPFSCRYYDPLTMDGNAIFGLMAEDTTFVRRSFSWQLEYVYVDDSGIPQRCIASGGDTHQDGLFRQGVLASRMTVVRIYQTRFFGQHKTTCAISLDQETWLEFLTKFDILPSFLELLHDNNGGNLLKITDSGDDDHQHDVGDTIHVGYKPGNWSNKESAIYGRYDIQSGRSFILLKGADSSQVLDRVKRMLDANDEASFLHVIHALQSVQLAKAEQHRWSLDYQVQELETETGITVLEPGAAEPLGPEGLRVNKQLIMADEFLCNAARGSKSIRLHFRAFLKHLDEFQRLTEDTSPHKLERRVIRDLRNSAEMKRDLAQHQYDQIQELRVRIKNQREITAALIAERDTQINIEIAKATNRDSELMRGIAAVTMIFFPATFVATFFSMVFFHVGDEHKVRLTVEKRIWLYPVVTLPLTFIVAAWYLSWSHDWS